MNKVATICSSKPAVGGSVDGHPIPPAQVRGNRFFTKLHVWSERHLCCFFNHHESNMREPTFEAPASTEVKGDDVSREPIDASGDQEILVVSPRSPGSEHALMLAKVFDLSGAFSKLSIIKEEFDETSSDNDLLLNQRIVESRVESSVDFRSLFRETELIKETQEFVCPQDAIDHLLRVERELKSLSISADLSSDDQQLETLIKINVYRGLMNAYRFIAVRDDDPLEAHVMLRNAHEYAGKLLNLMPLHPREILEWLKDWPIDDRNTFYAILCNDMGKYLKDTPSNTGTLSVQTSRIPAALEWLNEAIAYSLTHPSSVFSREAWVDATIILRLEEKGIESRSLWPSLFNENELECIKSQLLYVIDMCESPPAKMLDQYSNAQNWQAYKDAKATLEQLINAEQSYLLT